MSSRSAQAHKNINFIQRHVNWRQMELFFSIRAEGRENKLPFPLLANRERKSLSRRGNCTVCWKTSSACFLLLCCLLFTFLLPLHHCEKMSACPCEHVPLRVSSGIPVPSLWPAVSQRQRWQVWPFVPHQYAWVPVPRLASANQHVSLQVFPSLSSPTSSLPTAESETVANLLDPECHIHFLRGWMSLCVLMPDKILCSHNDVWKYLGILRRTWLIILFIQLTSWAGCVDV